jgi:predicted metal-binding membrane protein
MRQGAAGTEPGTELTTTSPLEAVLKRDRAIVIGGLVGVIVLAWIYILLGAGMGMTAIEMTAISDSSGDMQAVDGENGDGTGTAEGGTMSATVSMAMAVMQPVAWSAGYAVLMVFMWWIMMVAMMLPSAAPMILLYAAVNRKARERGAPFVPTGVFALGYLAAWGVFSLLAVALQWGLERTALLSSMMVGTSIVLGGLLLIAAGAWQLTPLKHACLKHCRSPLHFLSHHWRKGRWGAFRMGAEHGAFCLGCCWFLMGLLFYGGVMNLYWIVGLAAFVLLEKTAPAGHWIGSAAGVGLIAWGGLVLLGSL